jgi:excisionase family DNA binding protein
MTSARDNLGPATEGRVAKAFAECALISAQAAAPLVGVNEKTLREMAQAGVIRSVIVGASTRRYTEADLRAYLAGERFGEMKACPSTNRRRAASGTTTSNFGVTDIRDLLAQRRARKPSGLKRQSVSQPPRAS